MHDLAAGLRFILGERLVGLYVGGSLSLRDYVEASSDIDFLAVTDGPLSPEDLLAVGICHRELLNGHALARRLEGDYAPQQTLVSDGTTCPVPGCERGIFLPKVGEIMLSADNIYNLREDGITVVGPSPRTLLPPVSCDQVRQSVRMVLADGPFFSSSPEETADQLLDLCRSLCTLEKGRPASKSEGAAWVRSRVEERWLKVIEAAMTARQCGCARGWDGDLCRRARDLGQSLRTQFLKGYPIPNEKRDEIRSGR
jgi:hypothetical protein